MRAGRGGARTRLSELLIDLATRIPALSDSLSDRYLSHASVSRHLGFEDAKAYSPERDPTRGGDL